MSNIENQKQMRKIPFSVTQDAANGYKSVEIQLPTVPSQGIVFDLDRIEIEHASVIAMTAINTAGDVGFQLTKSIETTIRGANYDGMIAKRTEFLKSDAGSVTGIPIHVQDIGMKSEDRTNYLAMKSIHVGMESSGCASAESIQGFLLGTVQTIGQKKLQALVIEQTLG